MKIILDFTSKKFVEYAKHKLDTIQNIEKARCSQIAKKLNLNILKMVQTILIEYNTKINRLTIEY